MENQTPITQVVETPQVVQEIPKVDSAQPRNNFLVILLSVLLFLSVLIAGFFAFQTQKLVKELTVLKSEPTPDVTVEPKQMPVVTNNLGYHGYNLEGKRFTMDLLEECVEERKPFDVINITCDNDDFVITINPQAGGQGMSSTPVISKLKLGNYEWEKRLFVENQSASYGLTAGADYYLVEVVYKPYSVKSSDYFEKILSTFKFTN